MRSISDEIEFKKGGIMEQRANDILNKAYRLLEKIKEQGLFKTIEQGIFAGIKRPMNGGKGLSGVVLKDKEYINPFMDLMNHELKKGGN